MNSKDYITLEEEFGAHNYHPLDVVIDRAQGVWVHDCEGNKYLDFLAAYSAVNQGHCHPRIVAAMTEQAQKVALTSRAFRNTQLPLLEKELCELLGYDMMLPMNSGAEAVETALKAARKWGYTVKNVPEDQAEIIVCADNFHGRTIAIVGMSTEAQYRDGFGPFTPGFKVIPYGDVAALKAAITPNTVAFLVEPIQGESGVRIPPEGYLKEAADICKSSNVLLMADEIQSGLGRSGKLLAHHWDVIRADVVIIGKALSGGMYPVSAVLSDRDVLGVFKPGDHGSTFGGNPLACAVAREALRVIVDEKLCERSHEMGNYLKEKLQDFKSPHIQEVRGRGLFIGVELKESAGGARRFCEQLKEKGVLCKETHTHVIRLAPPLVIERPEIDFAIDQLEAVLS
ncbi:MAG: ornithine--oxo-acid transaminase [Deltaproteobacteria bacterium CG11_big_fil_rev_8_21_14_0_20_47_16]|nr:MAG: ornithine--oxo-acid transaminase [Deltaproteobacteria bacterium CG11_big_fil_rev_8_21_14_0_20_47_16]